MRRFRLPALAAFAALTTVLAPGADVAAQQQQRRGGAGGDQAEEARRERTRREFETPRAQLDREANAGPCPFVKVLYDAARYVEFAGAAETPAQVAYTGEIQGVEADCRYREDDPIRVDVDVLFALGRGPQAKDSGKQYRWWVAVTERNRAVLAKEYFALNAEFERGQDRVALRERLGEIVIPRANQKVSGNNFEILVGFDVTPAQAAFNRDGKRFRMTAGQTAQSSQAPTGQTPTR